MIYVFVRVAEDVDSYDYGTNLSFHLSNKFQFSIRLNKSYLYFIPHILYKNKGRTQNDEVEAVFGERIFDDVCGVDFKGAWGGL